MYHETLESDLFFVWLLFYLSEAQEAPVTGCSETRSPMTNLCVGHKLVNECFCFKFLNPTMGQRTIRQLTFLKPSRYGSFPFDFVVEMIVCLFVLLEW